MTARVELYHTPDHVIVEHPDGIPERVDVPPQWRWRFVKAGRVMADSGHGYSRCADALGGCASVLGGFVREPIDNRPTEIETWRLLKGGLTTVLIPVRDLTRQP